MPHPAVPTVAFRCVAQPRPIPSNFPRHTHHLTDMQFSNFSQLPFELRHKIWQMTVQDVTLRFTVETSRDKSEIHCGIKVQRLTEPCYARQACQEAHKAIKEIYKDRPFKGVCGEMKREGKPWKITKAPGVRLDPGRDTIYLVDPTSLATFSVLAFAYPDLCETTTAIAFATLDDTGVSGRLASPCKYFPFSRKVTLVVVVFKPEDVAAAKASAREQLQSHLATCARSCTDFMRLDYATDFAEHRETVLYVSSCYIKDIMASTPDKAEFCGSYNEGAPLTASTPASPR